MRKEGSVMDFKYLETFKTILEEGNFAKAANKLNYTQSTITFQMQQLEKELSMQLFEKIGRKMQLTKAGENLIPYVKEVLSSVEKMQSIAVGPAMKQELQIGVAETQLCYKLPPILKKFHQQAPNAKLLIRSMNCYEIRDALVEGGIDLGIFYEDVGGCNRNLTLQKIGRYPMSLVASPSVRQAFPDFITPDQQMEIPLIIDEPRCIFREIFEDYLKQKEITLGYRIELWSIPTIKNLVASDMGLSYLPSFTVEKELAEGTLCKIDTELDDRTITAVCGIHKNKWISPLMQIFIDLLTDPSIEP